MATLLSIAGTFAVFSTCAALWSLWRTDPLKSIGGFAAPISLLLIVRVWRSLGWELEGSWWGLAMIASMVALVHLRDVAVIELIVTPAWTIFVPPHQVVALMYVAGAVLLFGGMRLLRGAAFPVALVWLVNPVPNFFTLHVDLPLQHFSSLVARGFAHGLGQRLTPDQLRLMFTPEFGMFIAPGCDGIRGAVTMGMIALVAGYVYRFPRRTWALVVAGAVLLAYVFNLARLCTLVLYYVAALHVPWLQSRAETADYVIGACLFFVATAMLFTVIQRLSPTGSLRVPALPRVEREQQWQRVPGTFLLRWLGLAAVVLVGSYGYARGLASAARHSPSGDGAVGLRDARALGPFPERVGPYRLVDRWDETLITGATIFYFADYVYDGPAKAAEVGTGMAAGSPTVVSVGVSPVLGAHDTLICHSARGEEWLWHGNTVLPTKDGDLSLSTSLFNDGSQQYVEADTVCQGETCGQYSSNRTHFGLVYSRPDTHTLLSPNPERPIPILLRATTKDAALAPDVARAQLTAELARFLAGASVADFVRPYRRP
jgi:exosortase J